ncbi:hypothetical protein SCLCIDRAFT_912541 [Scleroderma citrinum Foug A]|uniref:Uncharacterized protein n=1 Tax=Scleroderma citrinum Foug A TaxID=1036808 RepID=A0A0C3DZG6_9AGAM|nr:hypothetical protein SCLCIDRAFT_912541 [Scleroderma citrinum Foug A]
MNGAPHLERTEIGQNVKSFLLPINIQWRIVGRSIRICQHRRALASCHDTSV